jgi:predicted metal-dependent HD superfamily phosphohydrolase
MNPVPTTIPWTRLQSTPLFEAAIQHQSSNRRRHYHNANHVMRLYQHAATTFDYPYSRALDLAIVAHDVIFDCRDAREMRSIDWLEQHLPQGSDDPDFMAAKHYILTTIDHVLTPSPEMALLDLADFIDPEVSATNTELLRLEARDLHGVKSEIFAMGCTGYLEGLLKRFKPGTEHVERRHLNIHSQICHGIFKTKASLHAAFTQSEYLNV